MSDLLNISSKRGKIFGKHIRLVPFGFTIWMYSVDLRKGAIFATELGNSVFTNFNWSLMFHNRFCNARYYYPFYLRRLPYWLRVLILLYKRKGSVTIIIQHSLCCDCFHRLSTWERFSSSDLTIHSKTTRIFTYVVPPYFIIRKFKRENRCLMRCSHFSNDTN